VVVEPGEDLCVIAGGEAVVGEVGLPGFVGLLGSEADARREWASLRLVGDAACSTQVAVDRRGCHRDVVVVEVPTDGGRAGVETRQGEFVAQTHDQIDRLGRRRVRRCAGPS
jgi:hypothetical protein